MILGRCIQFEHLTVHQKERKGGRWRKMRNGRSKSFALTSSPHNQSPCYCSHSLSVKSILAVNTPVVLAVCYTAAAIDQCQLDRLRCEHVKGKQSCCAIMENKKNGVSQKNKKKGGGEWVIELCVVHNADQILLFIYVLCHEMLQEYVKFCRFI